MGKNYTVWWIIGIIVLIIGLSVWGNIASKRKHASLTNREVALICTTDMATQFHVHPILKVIVKGTSQEIPANIGIKPECMNPLHTHDASGVIHVESPEKRDFTLGDFFAVWGKDMRSFGSNMKMTVNGKENTEDENYVMHDGDQIELRYD